MGKKMSVQVIAEIGWNFMGDMDLAKKMISAAKESGADIAKFQYWNPSRLKPGIWDEDGRREIYENAKLDDEKIHQLKKFCEYEGINFLVSAFNVHDAKYLKANGLINIKVPSHEVANYELHKYSAKNFDQIFVSLGAGETHEIEKTIEIYNSEKAANWIGMHCVSSYPVPANKANLLRLNYLKDRVLKLGYSDHTSDMITPSVAVAFGISVIEKHFTIDKELPGRDNKFALDADEFKIMVQNIRLAEDALIDHGNDPMDIEMDTIKNYRGRWGSNF